MLSLRSPLFCFALIACNGAVTPSDDASDTSASGDQGEDTGSSSAGPVSEIDYRETGSYSVTTSSSSFNVGNGCTFDSAVFTPQGAPESATVILSHGFARGKTNMEAWGSHIASWGVTVIAPDLCHASPFDTNHEQNGVDLAGLSATLDTDAVIYVGHSAGGLASVLAGSSDSKAKAVIGLDLTDASNAAVNASKNLGVPYYGIAGEPSSCNSNGNGTAVVGQGGNSYGIRVVDADHCDFEGPTDGLCTAFCGNGSASISDSEIQATIRGLLTSAIMGSAGLDSATTDQWWSGGIFHDELLSSGSIQPL
jgi:hypothetical protein